MAALIQIERGDRRLLEGIQATMAEAARRSGAWLVCRPGCTQCCMGPFPITQLDARRLRAGLRALEAADPERAAAVRARALDYVQAAAPVYPGDPVSGALFDAEALPESLDEAACPSLDSATGLCDLYEARPIACRRFGPATKMSENTLGACELCYVGATPEQMMECAVEMDAEGIEDELIAALEAEGASGMTIVAYALAG